ncbi:MAG: hypothetical protein VX624_16445, partial [Pseudomonadota bacterium]|nr:hypothetical protein [Pseudomonadota bacterium]
PFVVPVGNIVRDYAEPVEYDGTAETISIRHPDTKERYEMHSLLGVYRVNDGVMEPMQSGTVATGSGTYRVVDDGRGQFETHKRIALDLPQAFDQAVTVSVDAHWHQTWLSEYVNEKFEYGLYRSADAGLKWSPVGDLQPLCRPASLQQDDKYLQLFSLQNKPQLNHRDVIALLNALGPVGERAFGSIRSQWRGTRCEQVPDTDGSGKLKTQFVFQFGSLSADLVPVAELWVHYVSRILDVWLAGTKVTGVAEYLQ